VNLTVGIGLLGCGNVGSSVADRLVRDRRAIEARTGVGYELRAVAIRRPDKRRLDSLDPALFTTDPLAVAGNPAIDLVIELIGGTAVAAELLDHALEAGQHVVTANKDLLGLQGPRLRAFAAARGTHLRFEGAIAGAIPIVRVLDRALAGDRIDAVAGAVNGTSTFILAAMEEGAGYEAALGRAQECGYAEADPANDVDGVDAAHKLALAAQLAFESPVVSPSIARRGISGVTRRDVARARMLGLRIRSVGAIVRAGGEIWAEVAPVALPEEHEFARTFGVENAVRIDARDAGTLFLRGQGAGGTATASAVLGDVVTALRSIHENRNALRRPRARAAAPSPVGVLPLFSQLPRIAELPHYPIWDDAILAAPAAQQSAALSGPGKD